MAKVKVTASFIGSPEEVEKYGGKISGTSEHLEKRMTDQEKATYAGKINPGTEMEVSDKRAEELLKLGVIEGDKKKAAAKEDKTATTTKEEKGAKVLTTKNVKTK